MRVHFNKEYFSKSHGKYIAFLALLSLLLGACQKQGSETLPISVWEAPSWFPEMDIPEDNAFTLSRWELGKKLFYETRMSIDNSISCASCHDPKLSFSDKNAFSPGVFNRPGTRNASMLANIGYAPNFLREGGIPTLEMQVLVPIQEHNEFNHNIIDIAEALNNDSVYQEMAMKAYESEVTAFVITRALGNFQRTLISGNSAYDQYLFLSKNVLNDDAKKGMELFNSSRLKCSECHSGVFFTNFDFANNGLKQMYADSGRMRLTGLESDRAVFKVPSLRNIEVTGPYLHDGSLETLMEVIELYSNGGFDHANKSELLQNPIELSNVEKNQLHAFLLSLTDHSFLYDERWQKDE